MPPLILFGAITRSQSRAECRKKYWIDQERASIFIIDRSLVAPIRSFREENVSSCV